MIVTCITSCKCSGGKQGTDRERVIKREKKKTKRREGCRKKEGTRRERKRKTIEIGGEAVAIEKGARRTRGKKEMEKQKKQIEQAEKEKTKRAIESRKEELRLLAEREVINSR